MYIWAPQSFRSIRGPPAVCPQTRLRPLLSSSVYRLRDGSSYWKGALQCRDPGQGLRDGTKLFPQISGQHGAGGTRKRTERSSLRDAMEFHASVPASVSGSISKPRLSPGSCGPASLPTSHLSQAQTESDAVGPSLVTSEATSASLGLPVAAHPTSFHVFHPCQEPKGKHLWPLPASAGTSENRNDQEGTGAGT